MPRQWFAVSMLFENISDSDPRNRLWEESIVLLHAEDKESARLEANRLAKTHEVDYSTCDGGYACWRFKHIERVVELGDDIQFKHGLEVFSRHLRATEVESLLTPFD